MRIVSFDFSIQSAPLGNKLELTGGPPPHVLDPGLPHQPAAVFEDSGLCVGHSCLQYGGPQGPVLATFLFTQHTADFSLHSPHSHLLKFSDGSAVVGLIRGDGAYRELVQDFVDWCQQNHLQLSPKSWWWISAGTDNSAHR